MSTRAASVLTAQRHLAVARSLSQSLSLVSYRSTIEALAAALEMRDVCTGRHVHRVTRLATDCLLRIDPEFAEDEEVTFGFMLHDVGKIGVPDAILNKPGPLSPSDWEVMHRHPEMGVKIVAPLGFTSTATDVILHHHERWDGKGYPHGLAGEDIPITARAFAVVDAFDAMTSDRPYRSALDVSDAVDILRSGRGSQFDPDMVELVLEVA
ncbi:MAG: HD-GYP domain-containing protein [Actinomycetota bacterium]